MQEENQWCVCVSKLLGAYCSTFFLHKLLFAELRTFQRNRTHCSHKWPLLCMYMFRILTVHLSALFAHGSAHDCLCMPGFQLLKLRGYNV